jgi:FkbM family methyltransferase
VPIKSRVADVASRIAVLEPLLTAIRAARVPAWQARSERDDRHLKALIAAALGAGSNAVDVGAASGTVLAEIVRVAPRGRHVAFEPRGEAARELSARFPGVEVREAAASDTTGATRFTVVRNIPELSALAPPTWPHDVLETELRTVATERLDDVIAHQVDFLKIDAEGAELACLRGARRLIAQCRPTIVFEHGATLPTDPGDAEIWQLLVAAGMRVFTIDGDGPLDAAGFVRTSASGAIWNFIARPA